MELLRRPVRFSLQDTKRHVPFSFHCPEGVSELHLDWRFSPLTAGELKTLITLSLTGPDGFRGAGHRHGDHQVVTVGAVSATPGYRSGPLSAGEWTVTLHTHLVVDATEGELVVTGVLSAVSDRAPAAPEVEKSLPVSGAPTSGWMMGDLHCHTQHSDGRWTPPELAEAAARRGLGFLALTDHNTFSGRDELAGHFPGLTLPGLELTTFYGHAVVVGVPDYLDWTELRPDAGMREVAERVAARGGQLTIAHPFAVGDPICTGCAWTTFDLRPDTTTHLEVWNGTWAGRHNERALTFWYRLLAEGKRVIATAGTDAHGPAYLPGVGFTCTPATADPETLLSQLRSGMTYLGEAANLAPVFVSPGGPVAIGGTGQAGAWTVSAQVGAFPAGSVFTAVIDGRRFTEELTGEEEIRRRYEVAERLNLEVRGPDDLLLALTNPVYATPLV